MKSKEIVKKTIEFNNSERIPFRFEQLGVSDFLLVGKHILLDKLNNSSSSKITLKEKLIDEFGTIWLKKTNLKQKQVYIRPVKPVLESWDDFKNYSFPDASNEEIYSEIPDKLNGNKDKFVFAKIPGIFQRTRFLRGFENVMCDFQMNPKKLKKIIDLVYEYIIEMLKNYKKIDGIDGIRMEEDWGTQRQSFIDNAIFREFFHDVYKKLVKYIHSNNWYFCMHSDGKINSYIDSFIDCGVDIIGLEQPQVVGIKEISNYKGQICIEGSVDTQFTLPTDDYNSIKREAKKILNNWCTEKGGFIAVCNHSTYLGVEKKSIECAYKAFKEYDPIRDRKDKVE